MYASIDFPSQDAKDFLRFASVSTLRRRRTCGGDGLVPLHFRFRPHSFICSASPVCVYLVRVVSLSKGLVPMYRLTGIRFNQYCHLARVDG